MASVYLRSDEQLELKHMVCLRVVYLFPLVCCTLKNCQSDNEPGSLSPRDEEERKGIFSVRTHRLDGPTAAASAWSKLEEKKRNTQLMDRERAAGLASFQHLFYSTLHHFLPPPFLRFKNFFKNKSDKKMYITLHFQTSNHLESRRWFPLGICPLTSRLIPTTCKVQTQLQGGWGGLCNRWLTPHGR